MVHVAYKTINTRTLEKWPHQLYSEDGNDHYSFANELKETWGRIVVWEATVPDVRGSGKYHKISYRKKSKLECFVPSVSSSEDMRDRLVQMLDWIHETGIKL